MTTHNKKGRKKSHRYTHIRTQTTAEGLYTARPDKLLPSSTCTTTTSVVNTSRGLHEISYVPYFHFSQKQVNKSSTSQK